MNTGQRGLPPPHHSLPKPPHAAPYSTPYASTSTAGPSLVPSIGYGITAALSNPYASQQFSQYQQSYSSHYAQAYMQSSYPGVATTPEGYTLSPSYNPSSASATPPAGSLNYSQRRKDGPPSFRQPNSLNMSQASWYQPGNVQCSHKGCSFSGSHKATEIHMMDRHLIYPPGWERRNKKQDWDADPSLKGKPIPIQGTTVILDSPEVLDAWIAERKKRWPSAGRVEDKKKKMEEAVARGQLSAEDIGLRPSKRRKAEDSGDGHGPHKRQKQRQRGGAPGGRGRGRGRGNGNANGGSRQLDGGWQGMGRGQAVAPSGDKPELPALQAAVAYSDSDANSDNDESGEDDAPEVVSSKIHGTLAESTPKQEEALDLSETKELQAVQEVQMASQPEKQQPRHSQPRSLQPKKQPRNPFASRPTLLRNLLLPEIRMTISNLSQAIRFLVENDFLEGVELKPGKANEKMIEVLNQGDMKAESGLGDRKAEVENVKAKS